MARQQAAQKQFSSVDISKAVIKVGRVKSNQALMRWYCRHFHSHSNIEAYNIAAGENQIIAKVSCLNVWDKENVAEFMVSTLNHCNMAKDLIQQMVSALEECLSCEKLTWGAEYGADIIVRRARDFLMND